MKGRTPPLALFLFLLVFLVFMDVGAGVSPASLGVSELLSYSGNSRVFRNRLQSQYLNQQQDQNRAELALVVLPAPVQAQGRNLDLQHDQITEWQKLGFPMSNIPDWNEAKSDEISTFTDPKSQSDRASGVDYEKMVTFYLLTRDEPDGVQFKLQKDQIQRLGFVPSRTTKIIIHGYGHDITEGVIKDIANAYHQAGEPFNIIGVDWGKLCPKPHYVLARRRVRGVGKRVAALVDFLVANGLVQVEDVHVIGHSLGAHVAGVGGRSLTSGPIGRLTGLDPAFPLFALMSGDRLSKKDATLVDVIHSCSGYLGYPGSLGHVDFYPNGGSFPQPGCGLDVAGSCSHMRSYELYAESIVKKDAFQAIYCKSDYDARHNRCQSENSIRPITARMGEKVEFRKPGSYYVHTSSSSLS